MTTDEYDAFLLGRRDAINDAMGLICAAIKNPTLGVQKVLSILDNLAEERLDDRTVEQRLHDWRTW